MWQWEARVLQPLQYYSCWHHPTDKTKESLERLPLKLKNEDIILNKWQQSHSSVLQGLKLFFSFRLLGKFWLSIYTLWLVEVCPLPQSTFIFFLAMFINVCNILVCLHKDCLYICNWYSTSSLVGFYSVQTCSLVFDIFLLTVTLVY